MEPDGDTVSIEDYVKDCLDTFVKKAYDEGWKLKDIARAIGRKSHIPVRKKLQRMGVEFDRALPYTKREDEILIRMYAEGCSFREIDEELGRKYDSAYQRLVYIGEHEPAPTKKIDEHRIKYLYSTGMPKTQVAKRVGSTLDTVNRVLGEVGGRMYFNYKDIHPDLGISYDDLIRTTIKLDMSCGECASASKLCSRSMIMGRARRLGLHFGGRRTSKGSNAKMRSQETLLRVIKEHLDVERKVVQQ